jgi:hypothetical protein
MFSGRGIAASRKHQLSSKFGASKSPQFGFSRGHNQRGHCS